MCQQGGMVFRYIDQQASVVATLVKPYVRKILTNGMTLSENDIANFESLVLILKPLISVTTVLCDKKCCQLCHSSIQ